MQYKYFTVIFGLFIFLGAYEMVDAQKKDIVPVSPEAAALAKSVNYPVNKNTGIPDISIPFYKLKVGNLTLPLKLTYHGGGFKIHAHATRVGLGWSLSSTLQITRTINGLDDFIPNRGYIGNSLMKAYDPSSYNSYYPFHDFNAFFPSRNAYELASGNKDGEPDKFYYKLLDKSGSFYFRKNASGSGYTIVPVPYNNIKITFNNGQFIIVDTDGTTYYFGKQGTGDINDLASKGKEVTGNIGLGTCDNCRVTAWKCMRIEGSISTNTITFSYQPKTVVSNRSYNDKIEFYNNEDPCSLGVDGGYYHSNETPMKNYTSYENVLQNIPFYRISSPKYMIDYANGQPVFHVPSFDNQGTMTDKAYKKQNYFNSGNKQDVAGLSLSKIEFRGGKVMFYGTNSLQSIEILDKNDHTIKAAHFYQSYKKAVYKQEAKHYDGQNFNGTRYLDSLHIGNGGNTYERYAFLYNDKFCYGNHLKGHDAWGYPNASTMEIAYAKNTVGDVLSIPNKTLTQDRYYFDVQGGCTNFIKNLEIEIGGEDWAEQPNEQQMKKGTLKRIIYPTGGFVDFDWEANKYLETFRNDYGESQKMPRLGGGLRIRSISYFNGMNNDKPVMQKYYHYGELENGTGILINRPRQSLESGKPHYEAVDYEQQIAYLEAPGGIPGCGNRGCLSVKTLETKTTYGPASFLNYTYVNGNPIYYTKVSVYQKDFGKQSGKTVYDYYPPDKFMNYPAILRIQNRIPNTPISYQKTAGLMGAEKSESQYIYDSLDGYRLVHRKSFEYDRYLKDLEVQVAVAFFHVSYQVVEGNYTNNDPSSLYNDHYSFSGSLHTTDNEYITQSYGIPVGKLLLSKKTDESFDGNNILTQTTQYFYDNPTYLQPSRIVHSDYKANTIVKTIKYPYDFNGVYSQMVAENMIAMPIEVTKTNTDYMEISKRKTNYDYIQKGWGFFAPKFIQTSFGGGSLSTEVTFDQYDQYGNILQRTLRDGIPVSYLWGYNAHYPVAKLTGVKYDQIPSTFLSNVQIINPSSSSSLRSLLDNLRNSFYGKEQITTYTYKRLVGMTSETSPNDYTTYYEYDPIGRLILKKDNDQRILKNYTYSMTGPTSNSLSSWYVNYPMMETHALDCGGGNHFSYNYVVPGGKYLGYSQQSAKTAAEYDLDNDYSPPMSGCPVSSVTIPVKLEVAIPNNAPNVGIDFLQNESVIASKRVPNTYSSPSQDITLYLKPGTYQISIRPNAAFHYYGPLIYRFIQYNANDQEDDYSDLEQGATVDVLENKHYEFIVY